MKTRAFLIVYTAVVFVVLLSGTARAADLKNPSEIIRKSQAFVLSLDSYSVHIKGEGWDVIPKVNAKRLTDAAGEVAKKYSRASGVAKDVIKHAEKADNDKPIYRKHIYNFKFKKPYLLQMMVITSDYVPKVTFGSLLTYRPDQNPNIFYFKPKFSPVAFKRDIGSESGNLLYTVISQNNAMMESMRRDVIPELKGTGKVGGRDVYIIEFKFPKGKTLKPHPVDFKLWGIPAAARKSFAFEANGYTKGQFTRAEFFIDKENFLVLARTFYDNNDRLISRKEWSEFKLNSLTEKDF